MSDDIKYIDVDDEQFEDAPKALRDAYKALAAKHKEATTEVGQLRQTVASHALGDVLGNAGFKNPKRVEQDILRDGIDATDKAAVEKWLADNGDDYARATEGSADPDPAQEPQQQTPEQAAQAAAFQQLQGVQGDLRQPADMSKWELAKSEITNDMNGAEVAAVYAKHGI
jgi:hypothetical protein